MWDETKRAVVKVGVDQAAIYQLQHYTMGSKLKSTLCVLTPDDFVLTHGFTYLEIYVPKKHDLTEQ